MSDPLYLFRSTIFGIENMLISFVCVAFFLVVKKNFVGHCQRKILIFTFLIIVMHICLLTILSYCCFFIEIHHIPVFTERLCSQVDLFDYRKLTYTEIYGGCPTEIDTTIRLCACACVRTSESSSVQ